MRWALVGKGVVGLGGLIADEYCTIVMFVEYKASPNYLSDISPYICVPVLSEIHL